MVLERANGLYGPTPFLIANFIIGVPFLCTSHSYETDFTVLMSLLFAVVTYWLIDLRSGGMAFLNYLTILFLDLVAAEALVVMVSAIFPIFVVALALTAFANVLWMTVGGFLVSPNVLNAFWKYTFYQIDYQRYTFVALVRNQMIGSIYSCGRKCECMFVTSLASQCEIDGSEAVQALGFTTSNLRSYVCPLDLAVLILDYVDSCGICDENVCMDCIVSQKEMIGEGTIV